MNELLILGLVLAVFSAACAVDWLADELQRARLKLWAAQLLWHGLDWLDREITAYCAAKIVKRRVREVWRRAGGETDAGRNRL